jgi:hypothetical protein
MKSGPRTIEAPCGLLQGMRSLLQFNPSGFVVDLTCLVISPLSSFLKVIYNVWPRHGEWHGRSYYSWEPAPPPKEPAAMRNNLGLHPRAAQPGMILQPLMRVSETAEIETDDMTGLKSISAGW